jgi:diguanylate cyclase (GGDEF)-like protein/PAS domain S-box-containing protein
VTAVNRDEVVDLREMTPARPVRVVLADDLPEVRLLLRATLEQAGITVVAEASNGVDAVAAAALHQPDIVVLDYMMPGRRGLEAITEIRKCSPSSKILMLSAMTEEQVHDPRARSAPDAWLAKGATAATLTDAIARLVRGEPNEIEADADLDVDEWAAQALVEARAAFDDTFDAATLAMALLTTGGRLIRANPAYERFTGRTRDELATLNWWDGLESEDAARVRTATIQLLDGGLERYDARLRIDRPDGTERWGDLHLSVVYNADGKPIVLLAQVEDISDRLEIEARYHSAFNDSAIPTALVAPAGFFIEVNRALCKMLSRSEEQLIGAAWTDFVHPDDGSGYLGQELPLPGSSFQLEKRYLRPDGSVRWGAMTASHVVDGRGNPLHTVVQIQDITEQKWAQALLAHRATHDALTDLPNRTLLTDRLEVALARLARVSSNVAVMFCDIDRFKTVNDSLGHDDGDCVLSAVADRMREAVRPGDTVARFGGDEFVILCENLAYPSDAQAIIERVQQALVAPVFVGETAITVGMSVGIAIAQGPGNTAEDMIRRADTAMYAAKDKGRGCAVMYEPEMGAAARSRLKTEHDLRGAVEAGHLRIYYQPVIDLRDNKVIGAEALVRWQHPDRGLLEPSDFVPFAEESGVIIGIGHWVVVEACTQAQQWRKAYPQVDLTMSVNLSVSELAQPGLTDFIAETLTESGLPPDRLCVEITETALMAAGRSARRAIETLRSIGVRFGIDDFGTGYSSLAYLQQLPVDVLKLDRSFIDGLGTRGPTDTIVEAILRLGTGLGLITIAEGIERDEQMDRLLALGCAAGQGFLFGQPQPAEEMGSVLAASPR